MNALPPSAPVLVFRNDFPDTARQAVCRLPDRADIRRILIIKWGGMGDVVISTAIMHDIRLAFPHAEIHLNAMPPWHRLFEHDPRYAKVWCVDLRNRERGWRGMWRWLRQVRREHYDLIVDLQTSDRSRGLLGLLRLSGARIPYLLGNHPVFPYTVRQSPLPRETHGFAIMRHTLAAAGIPALTGHPVLYPSPQQEARAAALLDQHGLHPQRFAVFLPGSHAGGLTKRWGCDNYIRLARLLSERGMPRIVLVGGRDEEEECRRIAEACGEGVVNLCGQTELLELPAIYRQACFIVGNDTGTAHLAAAAMRPLLILCGPTDPRRVQPIGAHVAALQPDLPCKNCYLKTCSHHSCMTLLTPEIVLQHLTPWIEPHA